MTLNLKEVKLQNIKLELELSINAHSDTIFQISIFPSGKIISVSKDKSIKILNNDFKLYQNIQNAHEHSIFNVSIKNENSFVTCSYDESIKFWNKKEEKFFCSEVLKEAHYFQIFKVLYLENGTLISCSEDGNVKIWDEVKENLHQLKTIIYHKNVIYSFLLLNDINILVTSGYGGTYFWNYNSLDFIFKVNVKCPWWNSIERIEKDKVIIGGLNETNLYIINISKKEIVKEIDNKFFVNCILNIDDKGIFMVGGNNNNIHIYRKDNFELLKIFNPNHYKNIYGLMQYNKNKIITFSSGTDYKIWKLD